MNEVRAAFLDTTDISLQVLSAREVAARWDDPSALAEFSVRGLAGHLVRATTTVDYYLDRGPAEGPPASTADYYAAALENDPDISSPLHRAIRERGERQAAKGYDALCDELAGGGKRMRTRLEEEPADRLVKAHKDIVLLLDDYLVTRIVEQTVHIDDLAVSVNIATPELPPKAVELAVATMLGVARVRHGDLAIVRALSRRERGNLEALRVF